MTSKYPKINGVPYYQTNEYQRIRRRLNPEKEKEYHRRSYLKYKEKNNKISKEYYHKNSKRIAKQVQKRNQLIKFQVFNYYCKGEIKCQCCNEKEMDFLTLDHVNGGGTKHREAKGTQLYRWVMKNNFPEGFQVLCFNCNCGRGLKQNKGVCPHKKNMEILLDC